ncbi:MAG: hypothetical protein ACRDTQ_06380 [Micromonosporaceae bacterium]
MSIFRHLVERGARARLDRMFNAGFVVGALHVVSLVERPAQTGDTDTVLKICAEIREETRS